MSAEIDRAFKKAAGTGTLVLANFNLRALEHPDDCDIDDITEIDLSMNKFTSVPDLVFSIVDVEKVNMMQNLITSIPSDFCKLSSLVHLNMSRNQISALPEHLFFLPLEVLILNSNRISSLPSSIENLTSLKELDLSNNQLEELPSEIKELISLKELNVSRNSLKALPKEIGHMKIRVLNLSSNKITALPLAMRHMKDLEILNVDYNPLLTPTTQICSKGRVHIFKYLTDEAKRLHNEKYNPHHDGSGLDLSWKTDSGPVLQDGSRRQSVHYKAFVEHDSPPTSPELHHRAIASSTNAFKFNDPKPDSDRDMRLEEEQREQEKKLKLQQEQDNLEREAIEREAREKEEQIVLIRKQQEEVRQQQEEEKRRKENEEKLLREKEILEREKQEEIARATREAEERAAAEKARILKEVAEREAKLLAEMERLSREQQEKEKAERLLLEKEAERIRQKEIEERKRLDEERKKIEEEKRILEEEKKRREQQAQELALERERLEKERRAASSSSDGGIIPVSSESHHESRTVEKQAKPQNINVEEERALSAKHLKEREEEMRQKKEQEKEIDRQNQAIQRAEAERRVREEERKKREEQQRKAMEEEQLRRDKATELSKQHVDIADLKKQELEKIKREAAERVSVKKISPLPVPKNRTAVSSLQSTEVGLTPPTRQLSSNVISTASVSSTNIIKPPESQTKSESIPNSNMSKLDVENIEMRRKAEEEQRLRTKEMEDKRIALPAKSNVVESKEKELHEKATNIDENQTTLNKQSCELVNDTPPSSTQGSIVNNPRNPPSNNSISSPKVPSRLSPTFNPPKPSISAFKYTSMDDAEVTTVIEDPKGVSDLDFARKLSETRQIQAHAEIMSASADSSREKLIKEAEEKRAAQLLKLRARENSIKNSNPSATASAIVNTNKFVDFNSLLSSRNTSFNKSLEEEKKILRVSIDEIDSVVLRLMNALEELSRSQSGETLQASAKGVKRYLKQAGIAKAGDATITRNARVLMEEVTIYHEGMDVIENFLQELIPDCSCPLDLPEALMDGVVLCKIANKLEPGVIKEIFTEPDRAKVGTSLKIRKNVEDFLEFCRKSGISSKKMCSSLDILQQRETHKLVLMLKQLIKGKNDEQIAFV